MRTVAQDVWVTEFFQVDLNSFPPVKAKGATTLAPPTPLAANPAAVNAQQAAKAAPAANPVPGKAAVTSPVLDTKASPQSANGLTEALGPTDVIDVLKAVAGSRKATVQIRNNTEQTLILDRSTGKKLPFGHITTPPPSQIPKGNGEFTAENSTVLGVAIEGVEGTVKYAVDEQGTVFVIHFDNPLFKSNKADAHLEGPNKDNFDSDAFGAPGSDAHFTFTLDPKGGPKPTPTPTPTPTPGPQVNSSCLINVTNNTKSVLTLAHQKPDKGDFMTFPAATVQPGASTSFVYTKTPNSKEKDPGCKGSITWDVGAPATAVWRCEWDNPDGEKNTASATIDPQSGGFQSLEQIGQGEENVPVAFTISGGGAQPGPTPVPPVPVPPVPVPPVPVPPEVEPAFTPPATGARQPTLRKGDTSDDGWVEYLQELLTIPIDGKFGAGTERAVKKFQADNKLQVDGTVGNQTWAALREGKPEKPSTDGRKPHTFVEHGIKARFFTEKTNCIYFKVKDELSLLIESVGDQTEIAGQKITVKVSPLGGKAKVVKVVIDPAINPSKTGQGDFHNARIEKFKVTFPPANPAGPIEDYDIDAYFEPELGGDRFTGKPFLAE